MKKILLAMVMAMVMVLMLRAGTTFAQDSVEPVDCSEGYLPIMVAGDLMAGSGPCPGQVYCQHPSACGGDAFCCPWGYFYSNPCTCRCYRTSDDAGRGCSWYWRCN